MATLTGLGDAGVTLPAAAILFATFLSASRRVAAQWVCAVVACGAITAAGKFALYVYGQPIPTIFLASPSGHAAASVLIYGALAVAIGSSRRRMLPAAVAVAMVSMIAISRVYLGSHTEADVVAGLAIGGLCLLWFIPARADGQAWPIRVGALVCMLVCLIGTGFGWQLGIDAWLRAGAAQLVRSAAAATWTGFPQ